MKKIIVLISIISLVAAQSSLNAGRRHHRYRRHRSDNFGSGLAGGIVGGALTSTMINAGSRENNEDTSGQQALSRVDRLENDMREIQRQLNDMRNMMHDLKNSLNN